MVKSLCTRTCGKFLGVNYLIWEKFSVAKGRANQVEELNILCLCVFNVFVESDA